jgi:hypothetical protein
MVLVYLGNFDEPSWKPRQIVGTLLASPIPEYFEHMTYYVSLTPIFAKAALCSNRLEL